MKILLVILLVLLIPIMSFASEKRWIWIHGELTDTQRQAKYMKFTNQLIKYYGKSGIIISKISEETSRIKEYPEHYTMVWCGPLEAFTHLEESGFPVTIENNGIKIADRIFTKTRTGIYLSTNGGKRMLYTGLSDQGFDDIFSIPTGDHSCTVMENGKKSWEGDFNEETLELKQISFLPEFPVENEIKKWIPPEGVIQSITLFQKQNIPLNGSLPDLFWDWFMPKLQQKKALFLGESHWNRDIGRLFQIMISGIAMRTEVNGVLLELNYSFSGHFNHFVLIRDDVDALKFKETYLSPLVNMESTMELLDCIRNYNKANVSNPLYVGCHDQEWSVEKAISNIVYPYVKMIEPTLSIYGKDLYEQTRYKALLDRLEKLVNGEGAIAVKDLPFLTKNYVKNVLKNLKDTANSDGTIKNRHQIIQRNQTEFHKLMFENNGMVILNVGNMHAERLSSPDRNFLTDAEYLDQKFSLTKGKVYSLYTGGIGYDFTPLINVQLSKRFQTAAKYARYAKSFQESTTSTTMYLLSDRSSFNRIMIGHGNEEKSNVFAVKNIDWDDVFSNYGQNLDNDRRYFERFDDLIFVLRSPIDLPRLK